MSVSDSDLIRFVAPWIGSGFGVAFVMSFLLDVRGAIAAYAMGAIAPIVLYLPPSDDMSLVGLVLEPLRAPVPIGLGPGETFLAEATMDWWLGAAAGAALGLCARRLSTRLPHRRSSAVRSSRHAS